MLLVLAEGGKGIALTTTAYWVKLHGYQPIMYSFAYSTRSLHSLVVCFTTLCPTLTHAFIVWVQMPTSSTSQCQFCIFWPAHQMVRVRMSSQPHHTCGPLITWCTNVVYCLSVAMETVWVSLGHIHIIGNTLGVNGSLRLHMDTHTAKIPHFTCVCTLK